MHEGTFITSMLYRILFLLPLLSTFGKELCPDGTEPIEGYFSYEVILEGFEHNCRLKDLERLDAKIEATVINVENRISNLGQGTEIILKDCDVTYKPWERRNLRVYFRILGRYSRLGGGFCRRCPNTNRHLGKEKIDQKALEQKQKEEEERLKEKLEAEKQKQAQKEEEVRQREKLAEEKQKQAETQEKEKLRDEEAQIQLKLETARGQLDVVKEELGQKAMQAQQDMAAGPQKLGDFLKRFEVQIAAGVANDLSSFKCIAYTGVKVEVILLPSEDDLPCPLK